MVTLQTSHSLLHRWGTLTAVLLSVGLSVNSEGIGSDDLPDNAKDAWVAGVNNSEPRSALVIVEQFENIVSGGETAFTYNREFVHGGQYKVETYWTLEDAANRTNCDSVTLVNTDGSYLIGPEEDGGFFLARFLTRAEHDAKQASQGLPFERGLILDLPYMAWTFPLGEALSSAEVKLEGWSEVEASDGDLFQFFVRDVSGEIKHFNNIKMIVDRMNGYKIVDLEADFVNTPERFKKTRKLTYNGNGVLTSALLQNFENTTALTKTVIKLTDIQTVVPAEEFTPEFYGLGTPTKDPPRWTSRHYVIIALVAVIAITLIVIKKRQATEATV